MTAKTRYFVIASLVVLTVGLGVGLVAYYTGLPMGAFAGQGGPAELQLVPRAASVVAFADVHEIMLSNVRQKVLPLVPGGGNGRQEFLTQTGINPETDIDHIVVAVVPLAGDQTRPFAGIMLARGRFEDAKIEALMTDHGAQAETYKGKRLLVAPPDERRKEAMALAFIDQGVVAFGSPDLVRTAVDLKDGGDSVLTNDDVMTRARTLDDGNAWVVGRFDALSRGRLPSGLAARIPAISWFSASGRIDDGIRGEVRADANDDEAANNLREVIRGFVALAKLQAGARPELRDVVDSLNIGGTGHTVSLSFNIPSNVIDTLSAVIPRRSPASPDAR